MSSTPETTIRWLREGNARFVAGVSSYHFGAASREATVANQSPFATIVGCSDSRVPVEVVFDAGVGQLFVVRSAGHVLAASGLASVRFAAEKLGVRTVVVLGHEDCGAVKAALAGNSPEWLAPIVDKIDVARVDPAQAPADADSGAAMLAAAVDAHVRATVATLRSYSETFDVAEEIRVVGAAYKLASGEVHWLDEA